MKDEKKISRTLKLMTQKKNYEFFVIRYLLQITIESNNDLRLENQYDTSPETMLISRQKNSSKKGESSLKNVLQSNPFTIFATFFD